MTDIIPVGNRNATTKGYLDFSRPQALIASDVLWKTISSKEGSGIPDILDTASKLQGLVEGVKSFELDQVWSKMEKTFNNGRPLRTKSKTDMAKFQTAFGVFYNMINTLDESEATTLDLFAFQNSYFSAQDHVIRRILPSQSGMDLRTMQRTLDTINERLAKVVERFNNRVDAGEIAGPKV